MSLRNRIASGPGGANILVIDDDEIVLQAISDLLEGAGYKVHALVSPIGATQVIATQGITLAVIDLNMPVMRGDRFIALVRSWDRIRDLPIVLISGDALERVRAAAAQLPGVTVVTKPEMNERLVPVIQGLLRGVSDRTPSRGTATVPAQPRDAAPREEGSSLIRTFSNNMRNAIAAYREVSSMRIGPARFLSALAPCRAEAQTLGLNNVAQLLSVAGEVVESLEYLGKLPTELDATLNELLTQLANSELDKLRSYDRSLALTVHRSRLERARAS